MVLLHTEFAFIATDRKNNSRGVVITYEPDKIIYLHNLVAVVLNTLIIIILNT